VCWVRVKKHSVEKISFFPERFFIEGIVLTLAEVEKKCATTIKIRFKGE
jgi:hypothetical protein